MKEMKVYTFFACITASVNVFGLTSIDKYWNSVIAQPLPVVANMQPDDVHLQALKLIYNERREHLHCDTHKPYYLSIIVLYRRDVPGSSEDVDATIENNFDNPEFELFMYADTSIRPALCSYHSIKGFRQSSNVYKLHSQGVYYAFYKVFAFLDLPTLQNREAALKMQNFYVTVAAHKKGIADDMNEMQWRVINKITVNKFAIRTVLGELNFRTAYRIARLNSPLLPLPYISEEAVTDDVWNVYAPEYDNEGNGEDDEDSDDDEQYDDAEDYDADVYEQLLDEMEHESSENDDGSEENVGTSDSEDMEMTD